MNRLAASAADLGSVAVFAAVGRRSHAEGVTLLGVAETAWPFAAGCLLGHLVAGRREPTSYGAAALVWAGTLVGGMLLRLATGAGVQASFVVVAGIVLAVFLLGWRAVARLAARRSCRRRAPTDGSTTAAQTGP